MIYNELNFIKELRWNNHIQYQSFLLTFSKTINKTIDQYCELIKEGEIKSTSKENKPENQVYIVSNESCTKLCNIEVAQLKLADIYREINELITENYITDEESVEDLKKNNSVISGIYLLQILCGENLTPCNNDGFSNPYVVIRIPANLNTMENDDNNAKEKENEKVTVENMTTDDLINPEGHLDGEKNEEQITSVDFNRGRLVAKSSVVHDSLNPIWDETFQISVLPTKAIEILVYNKTSFLTSDELCGKKVVRLSSGWCDHQTHDIWIKLEPQGRLLIRITMDGEGEDLAFFFKKAKQRLMRALIDFLRALVHRISPYTREVLTKACKDNEAAPLPNKSIFSLTKSFSNLTPSGKSIDAKLTPQEAEEALLPLTEYLDKNLETLCSSLSSKMAQEVIFRTWCDILVILENLMVPQMYGAVERDRRILNKRQINFIEVALDVSFFFFFFF